MHPCIEFNSSHSIEFKPSQQWMNYIFEFDNFENIHRKQHLSFHKLASHFHTKNMSVVRSFNVDKIFYQLLLDKTVSVKSSL